MRPWIIAPALLALALAATACGDDDAPDRALRDGDALTVAVTLPTGAGPGLTHAGEDLVAAMQAITGATREADAPRHRVVVTLDGEATLGDEGYRLASAGDDVHVRAATEVGAMYGLYHVAADLGARWIHPEQAAHVHDRDATLPTWDGAAQVPHFAIRGFHEHTQHPIPASDFLLRPEDAATMRPYASRYIRWLARNRQNTLFFHMLGTVDLDAWVPYMVGITEEAHAHGVRVGAVIGFVDQQQNAFRLVRPDTVDGDGVPVPAEDQIRQGLDRVLETGLDHVGLQIGTSEFSKPDEAVIMAWLELAVAHLATAHPGVTPFGWIHITCSLERERGGYFYHLPLEVDGLGAFVHTTMFYDLENPAPVYDCEDFTHQQAFFEAGNGERQLVYFPESAWWLGFDNNLPLALPITGASREHDVRDILPAWEVDGHVTFTTGREWAYWQYDHYLTRLTWDGDLAWTDYLDWLAPSFGANGPALSEALAAWTDLQWRHFYEETPLIYFYLAGELPQDELGEQAGILARRPKLSFQKVLAHDAAEHAAWRAGDLVQLGAMRAAYAAVLADLPAADADLSRFERPAEHADPDALYAESYWTLWVYVRRIEHAIALYEGVSAARAGDRPAAEARLAEARAITTDVHAVLTGMEAIYRYPNALLVDTKPASPTGYPFGYLHETSSAYFWSRRDEQLEAVIAQVFDGVEERWVATPAGLFEATGDTLTVDEPDNDLIDSLLAGFVPRILLAPLDDGDGDDATLTIVLAQDRNANGLPDPETELPLAGRVDAGTWTASASAYGIGVYDGAGVKAGDLVLRDLVIAGPVVAGPAASVALTEVTLDGVVASDDLLEIVVSVAAIERDALAELVKDVWGIPSGEPLPDRLPLRLRLGLTLVTN